MKPALVAVLALTALGIHESARASRQDGDSDESLQAVASETEEIHSVHPENWWDLGREGIIAASWIRDDDKLEGFQLDYGNRGFIGFLGMGSFGISKVARGGENVVRLSAQGVLWPFAKPWGGIGPSVGVGLERRTDGRDADYGGYIALGIDFATWARDHWHFDVGAEYAIAISGESRGLVSLRIGFAHKHLTIGSVHMVN